MQNDSNPRIPYIYFKGFHLIDKRKDQRVSKKFVVSYGDDGFERIGMTVNISSNGMCVVSQSSLPLNKTVLLNLAMFDDVFEIMGLVKWSKSGFQNSNLRYTYIQIYRR